MHQENKPIPGFATEAEERESWEREDSTEFVDWSKARTARVPNLKPASTSISLRRLSALLARIKMAADKRDMP